MTFGPEIPGGIVCGVSYSTVAIFYLKSSCDYIQ